MGYLSTRIARLEHAAGLLWSDPEVERRRAAEAEWVALVRRDREATDLCRALALRYMGRTQEVGGGYPWERHDLNALPNDELRRRLDERVEVLRVQGNEPSGSGLILPRVAAYIPSGR